jgi:prophage tail gpP-like protein
MANTNKVSLLVDGNKYEGWLEFSLVTELQSLARSFAVSATRKKIENNGTLLDENLAPGKKVVVYIDDDQLLDGYIVSKEIKHDANSITISIKGSGKTIDILDCSVPYGEKTSFKKQAHVQNIAAVCKPAANYSR